MVAIETSNLVKQYPGALTPALNGMSLQIDSNKITGLLGPNGAGKTTTINIICGLVAPENGTAKVYGVDCNTDAKSVRSQIGVVPQQIALFPNLSARENFNYIGQLYNINKNFIRERSEDLLKRLDLVKHADKRVNRYSGGMKRRANIIASLLHYPEILILDEPTAGVDVQSRAMILDFIKEYQEMGKTVVYTSHLLDEAEKVCDEVIIIDNGEFVLSGVPRKLVQESNDCNSLEDLFLHHTGHKVRD